MKFSWIGIGFSHHSVPSLSNTATRSTTGNPAPAAVVCSTNLRIASLAPPGCQLNNGSRMTTSRNLTPTPACPQ